MRIVYWAHMPLAEAPVTRYLKQAKGIDLTIVKTLDELKAALPGADGLVAPDCTERDAPEVGRLLRDPSTTIRWLHVITAGREGFAEAKVPPNITVTGPAGAHSASLAEHAMAYLLAFTRRIPAFAANTPKHMWDRSVASTMSSLEGKTLALVGLGYAARAVAQRAKPYDMKIIAATRTPKDEPLFDAVYPLDKLHDVLAQADYIVVTIAQTPETRNLIGAAEFAACKPTAVIVNVARGAIVNTAALEDALRTGKIAGAGIDVTEPEPLPKDHTLWDAPNLIISPHLGGGASQRSLDRLGSRVTDNLERFQNGTLKPT